MTNQASSSIRSRRFGGYAIVVLLLAVLSLTTSQHASAQIGQQLVVTQTTYQECPNAATCLVVFPVVPTGSTFTVQFASCEYFFSPKANSANSLIIGAGTSTTLTTVKHFLSPIAPLGSNPTRAFYNVSTPLLIQFEAGKRPVINLRLVATATSFRLNCTISGTMASTIR